MQSDIGANVAVEQKVELVLKNETGLTGERWSTEKSEAEINKKEGEKFSLSMTDSNIPSV